MAHGAVEYASLTVTLDPHRAIVVIGANLPVAEIRFCGIDADQDMQFVARVRTGGQEMVKLVRAGETFPIEMPGERAVRVVDLQGRRLYPVRAIGGATISAPAGESATGEVPGSGTPLSR